MLRRADTPLYPQIIVFAKRDIGQITYITKLHSYHVYSLEIFIGGGRMRKEDDGENMQISFEGKEYPFYPILIIYFLLKEVPSESLALPPVGVHRTVAQDSQVTAVWA